MPFFSSPLTSNFSYVPNGHDPSSTHSCDSPSKNESVHRRSERATDRSDGEDSHGKEGGCSSSDDVAETTVERGKAANAEEILEMDGRGRSGEVEVDERRSCDESTAKLTAPPSQLVM